MKKLFLILLMVLLVGTSFAQPTQDEKMEWFRDAHFGMFIHWGLYSIPGGEWQGGTEFPEAKFPDIAEWIMFRARIPIPEYEKLADQFQAEQFDADRWIKLVKDAGMKYIVITTRHHDGFAMFDSEVSKYNVVDATPFGRDVIKEISEACRKYDIKLGLYYSQVQDWHEPGGNYHRMDTEAHWDPDMVREPLMDYVEKKGLPQLKEILGNYGDVDLLWWDFPRLNSLEAAAVLHEVAQQYPNLIVNTNKVPPGI